MHNVRVTVIVGAALTAFAALAAFAPLAAAATSAPTTPLKDPFAPVLVAPSTPATTGRSTRRCSPPFVARASTTGASGPPGSPCPMPTPS